MLARAADGVAAASSPVPCQPLSRQAVVTAAVAQDSSCTVASDFFPSCAVLSAAAADLFAWLGRVSTCCRLVPADCCRSSADWVAPASLLSAALSLGSCALRLSVVPARVVSDAAAFVAAGRLALACGLPFSFLLGFACGWCEPVAASLVLLAAFDEFAAVADAVLSDVDECSAGVGCSLPLSAATWAGACAPPAPDCFLSAA